MTGGGWGADSGDFDRLLRSSCPRVVRMGAGGVATVIIGLLLKKRATKIIVFKHFFIRIRY